VNDQQAVVDALKARDEAAAGENLLLALSLKRARAERCLLALEIDRINSLGGVLETGETDEGPGPAGWPSQEACEVAFRIAEAVRRADDPEPPSIDVEYAHLRHAYTVLARMVAHEYPADRSLAEIANLWGSATPDELAALESLAEDA